MQCYDLCMYMLNVALSIACVSISPQGIWCGYLGDIDVWTATSAQPSHSGHYQSCSKQEARALKVNPHSLSLSYFVR